MVNLLREAPRPAVVRDHPLAPWFAVGTVCFGAFMGQLDASIVTVAFPALLPGTWTNRHRRAVGGVVATGAAAALAAPAPHAVSVVLLGLLGLGSYTPANNAEFMAAFPAGNAATAGGMVNMTRGIGTALGVAVVTLGLHVGRVVSAQSGAGQTVSMAVLAAAALAATWAGTSRGRQPPPVPGDTTADPADSLR
jgi:hypothetical protein